MANRGSLEWWKDQLGKTAESVKGISQQILELREFVAEIASDMERFEKRIERGPTQEEVRDAQKAMQVVAKEELQTQFAWASAQAPDITEPMLAHLLNTVEESLNPSISVLGDGTFEAINLITDCSRDLGTAEDWFNIVEAVRRTGASSDAARMIGWRKLYDSAILGKVNKTNLRGSGVTKSGKPKRKKSSTWNNPEWLNATYHMIIKDREGELDNTAGYWHFLEYGNQRRKTGVLVPYPRYGAPKAVSRAEQEINRKGKEMGVGITTYERKRTKGWHDRKKLLEEARRLLNRFLREMERIKDEEDMAKLANTIRGMITREIKQRYADYHGLESLRNLEQSDLHRIREKVIDRIANYQDYATERISDPAIPSGFRTKQPRLSVEAYLQGTRFRDVSIRKIFFY